MANAFLTPDSLPALLGSDSEKRHFFLLPDSQIMALVVGALDALADSEQWQEIGVSPNDAALWFDEWLRLVVADVPLLVDQGDQYITDQNGSFLAL